RVRHPSHDRVRIRSKSCKQRTQQRRPRNAPIVGPQRTAKCLAAEPSAASFIRDRPTPAANSILSSIELGPADAAGADHDDAAVASAMRANAGGFGIGDENGLAIGMLAGPRRLELAGLAGAGQSQAGDNSVEVTR